MICRKNKIANLKNEASKDKRVNKEEDEVIALIEKWRLKIILIKDSTKTQDE